MRKLKHHEQKLLKKVDFLNWKSEHNLRELQVCRAAVATAVASLLEVHAAPFPALQRPQALQKSLNIFGKPGSFGAVKLGARCLRRRRRCRRLEQQLAPVPPPQVMRRYHIQDRDDYGKYNKLCGMVTRLVATLKRLDPRDTARIDLTDRLLDK